MLQKFLPKLKKTEQKPSNLSPNLVSSEKFTPLVKYQLKRQSSLVIVLLSMAIPLLVGVFYLLNNLQDKTIDALYSQRDSLVSDLSSYEESELRMRSLAAKTELLKNAVAEKGVSSEMLKEVTSKIPGSVTLLSARIDSQLVSLTLSSYDVMDFSKLISAYLDSANVSEIALKSADYSSERQTYKVELDVHFK